MARSGRRKGSLIVEEIHTRPANDHWITRALQGWEPMFPQAWCYTCAGLRPIVTPRQTKPGLYEGKCGDCGDDIYRIGGVKGE